MGRPLFVWQDRNIIEEEASDGSPKEAARRQRRPEDTQRVLTVQFDPYRKWLGIPPEEQPPNHYRLLGIGLFESDPDVISNAADRQMVHLRSFQSGTHSELSQRILNELSAARVCLLDAQRKTLYDAQLCTQLAAAQPAPATTTPIYPVPPPPRSPSPPPPRSTAAPPLPGNSAPPVGSAPPVASAPPVTSAAPPVPTAAEAPEVRTGVSALGRAARTGTYARRRTKSAWQVPVIAVVVALGTLALLSWALSDAEREPSPEPSATMGNSDNGSSVAPSPDLPPDDFGRRSHGSRPQDQPGPDGPEDDAVEPISEDFSGLENLDSAPPVYELPAIDGEP